MKQAVAGEGMLHPAALVAAAVLAFNDHLGKALWPGTVTGKLSDVAGLLMFPLFLQALWELGNASVGRRWERSARVLLISAVATAVVFALVKVWPPASSAYRVVFGLLRWPLDAVMSGGLPAPRRVSLTPDVTDLVALPAAFAFAVVRAAQSGWRMIAGFGSAPPMAMMSASPSSSNARFTVRPSCFRSDAVR